MAVRYYDDAIIQKLKKWAPENSKLRVLKPSESKKLFELTANDANDNPFQLPFIALSRDNDIHLLQTTKSNTTFNGLRITNNNARYGFGANSQEDAERTAVLNKIPIQLQYQLDIYTKTVEDGDEYMREFLFKLINNPKIYIEVPYNGQAFTHIANIRVQDSVSDTSDITERIFSGQFSRWTISFEIQDAFLFNIPYRDNWNIVESELVFDAKDTEEEKIK